MKIEICVLVKASSVRDDLILTPFLDSGIGDGIGFESIGLIMAENPKLED